LAEVILPANIKIFFEAFYGNYYLTKIQIGDNAELDQSSFDDSLIQSYQEHGKGTYDKQGDGSWIK